MITNSAAPVIPSHDSSEVQNDDRQNGVEFKSHVSRNSVLFSVHHDANKDPNQPQTDSDGIYNAIE